MDDPGNPGRKADVRKYLCPVFSFHAGIARAGRKDRENGIVEI